MQPTKEIPRLSLGRRASDRWLASLVEQILVPNLNRMPTIPPMPVPTAPPEHSPLYTGDYTPHQRRPRRTKAQLRDALKRAVDIVTKDRPTWSHRRVLRRARVMVRTYEIV